MESDNLAYMFWTLEDGATMASTLEFGFWDYTLHKLIQTNKT
jgi:hypothetical protein